MASDISILRNKYLGCGAYIIGAGPSVKRLTKFHFPDPIWPVLAINAAAADVALLELDNDVYLVQQDGSHGDEYAKPGVTPLIQAKQEYLFLNQEHRITYDPCQWGMGAAHLTARIAVEIAKLMGCYFMMLLCFDKALTGEGPEEYKDYGKQIRKHLKGVPVCWGLPE